MPITDAFDKRCEAMAASIRRDLGFLPWGPLPLDKLLSDLGVNSFNPSEFPGMSESSSRVLFGDGAERWSAVTCSSDGHRLVIYTPLQTLGKRTMAVTHELAHILLVHTPSTLMFDPGGTWTIETYGLRDEAEAEWLMGCLLLPTPVLDRVAVGPWPESLEPLYGVTPELLHYRFGVTGAVRLVEDAEEWFRALLEDPPIWHWA